MVNTMTNGIPKKWRELPFINQMWKLAIQHHCGINLQHIKIADLFPNFVNIHFAFCYLL